MTFLGDAVWMPEPNEFIVKAVSKDGCCWENHGTYPTRTEVMEAIMQMDKSKLRLIGMEPHCKDAGVFQTHALQVVWEA